MLFRLEDVTKAYGAHEVLRGATFQVNPGEHIGLVGRNGAGKTTIFKLLLGVEDPDSGRIERARNMRMGLLEQQVGVERSGTVREATLEVFTRLHDMEAEMRRLEHEMASPDVADLDAVLASYSDLQHRFEEEGGFTYAARAEAVLLGLGFSREDLELPATTLSGGQRARLALARLLLEEPDLLLLDEPTNHLDIQAVEWLEEFLISYRSAYVIISHDRFLLDRTVGRIIAVDDGRATSYTGNYSAYIVQRDERRLLAEKRYREQQELIERTEDFIRRNLAGQKTKQAKSRRKMLEKMERVERAPQDRRAANFRLNAAARTGREVLDVDTLAVGYPGVELVSKLDLTVERGDRLGIIGGNGTGKTTLFKTLLDRVDPLAGEFTWGHNVQLGYYDQHLANLDPSNEVIEEMRLASPGSDDPSLRSYLARFLFTGDDVFKRVASLSGGERSRLSLAKLISGSANVLLLDEPTNHLDIPAREALESALDDFTGTLLIISHDRYFLDRICDRLLHLESGRGEAFEGSYSDWAEERALRQAEERERERADRARSAETAPRAAAPTPRPAARPTRAVAQIEAEIASVEAEMAELGRKMSRRSIATNAEKLLPLTEAHAHAAAQLEELMDEWEAASAAEATQGA
jgi:ATP-binding cassette subfamily F protein 3